MSLDREAKAGPRSEEELKIHSSGFQNFFVNTLCELSKKIDGVISFRAGQTPNLLKSFRISTKPMSIKTKTCTTEQGIPMLAGFIAVDQNTFGRKGAVLDEKMDGLEIAQQKLIDHDQKEEAEKFTPVPLKVTFREIFADHEKGLYSRPVEVTDPKNGQTYLEFTAQQVSDNFFQDSGLDRKEQLVFRIRGDQASEPDSLMEIEFRVGKKAEFKPLQVIAYEGYPVTGDADMLAVAVPISQVEQINAMLAEDFPGKGLHSSFDVTKSLERKELAVMYLLARHAIEGDPIQLSDMDEEEIFSVTDNPAVMNTGIITPYELLVMMLCNEKLAKEYQEIAPGSENLIRHGAESNNPGAPSDLNARMLHVWQGKAYVTESEKELVKFYMTPGLLESSLLPVNPKWKMELWAPVVKKQLELGQEKMMNPETIRSYNAFVQKQEEKSTKSIFARMGMKIRSNMFAKPDEKKEAKETARKEKPVQAAPGEKESIKRQTKPWFPLGRRR